MYYGGNTGLISGLMFPFLAREYSQRFTVTRTPHFKWWQRWQKSHTFAVLSTGTSVWSFPAPIQAFNQESSMLSAFALSDMCCVLAADRNSDFKSSDKFIRAEL
jgi:hypothetical protein